MFAYTASTTTVTTTTNATAGLKVRTAIRAGISASWNGQPQVSILGGTTNASGVA